MDSSIHGMAAGTASSPPAWRTRAAGVALTVEGLAALASVFWLLTANRPFITQAMQGRSMQQLDDWGFLLALALLTGGVHLLLVLLVASRRTVKAVIGVLLVASATAGYFTSAYGVYLDPSMLRNVLRTDPAEAGELLTWPWLVHMLAFVVLPLVLLWRVRLRPVGWRVAVRRRLGAITLALLAVLGAVLAVFQPLASLMRNHKELRYLMTPANVVWSVAQVAASDARAVSRARTVVAPDAQAGPSWSGRTRPLVVIVVVGETARAANWGLNPAGDSTPRQTTPRQTTPRLAALPVVNMPDVQACGTNTEVSVPCMFSAIGRRDYDQDRIRTQESLLHVAARAGVAVHWRDNQSGCKGVCDGLPNDHTSAASTPQLCAGGRCLDEALVHDLDQRLQALQGTHGTQLWVLHMLGNHGPSYFRRYPAAFGRFQPACQSDDLRHCSQQEIANAYDNALLYTDHVLATAIGRLAAHAGQVDSALVYASDHGESLGEHGLYLHGLPYAIAPEAQKRVPMIFWASPGLERSSGLRPGCLAPALREQGRRGGVAHDHIFHTVLGLLDVRTRARDAALDLTDACRDQPT